MHLFCIFEFFIVCFAFQIIMKKIFFILFLFTLFYSSCQYFEKQIPSEAALLKKELKSINWKEVDEFPSVVNCDSLEDKRLKQQCFFQYMTQLIQHKLSVDNLSILYPDLDTIEVKHFESSIGWFPKNKSGYQKRDSSKNSIYSSSCFES
jgi:hypothetical protein